MNNKNFCLEKKPKLTILFNRKTHLVVSYPNIMKVYRKLEKMFNGSKHENIELRKMLKERDSTITEQGNTITEQGNTITEQGNTITALQKELDKFKRYFGTYHNSNTPSSAKRITFKRTKQKSDDSSVKKKQGGQGQN